LALKVLKCSHGDEERQFLSLSNSLLCEQVFKRLHNSSDKGGFLARASTAMNPKPSELFEVGPGLCIGDLALSCSVKYIEFECVPVESSKQAEDFAERVADTTKKTIDAFQLLMAGGRGFVLKKQARDVYSKLTFNIY